MPALLVVLFVSAEWLCRGDGTRNRRIAGAKLILMWIHHVKTENEPTAVTSWQKDLDNNDAIAIKTR